MSRSGAHHKLGYRGTTNTLLNFGEGKFPVRAHPVPSGTGWAAREGLRCMFHMMNEARIGVRHGCRDARARRTRRASSTRASVRRAGRSPARNRRSQDARKRRSDHRTRRRQAHAAGAEGVCRRRLALGLLRRVSSTNSTPAPRAAPEAALLLEMLDAGGQRWQRMVAWRRTRSRSRSMAATATRATSWSKQYWRDNRLK